MTTPPLVQSPINPEWLIPEGWERILGFEVDYRLGGAVLRLWRVQWNQHLTAEVALSAGEPHLHPHHQLLYYRKGEGRLQSGGEEHHVGEGDIFFIPAGCRHRFLPGAGEPALCLALDFTLSERVEGPLGTTPDDQEAVLLSLLHTEAARPFQLRPVDQTAVDQIVAAMIEENRERELGFAAMIQGHLLRLMSLCLRATRRASGFGAHFRHTAWRHSVIADRAEALIVRQGCDPQAPGAKVAAQLCGTSLNQLNRILRRFKGQTYQQLLLHHRLEAAARLLRSGEANCTEAAFAAGFNDSNYFSRAFRKVYGHNPSDLSRPPS